MVNNPNTSFHCCLKTCISFLNSLASYWSIILNLASHWSGKEFPVHKSILSAEKINIDERYLETVFFGFSDEVTGTLLHYIYSQVSEYWPLIGQYWSLIGYLLPESS